MFENSVKCGIYTVSGGGGGREGEKKIVCPGIYKGVF